MIQSVDRALDILTCVSDKRGKPVTLSQIADATKLNASTCAHIVDTLTKRGFLNRVSRSSGYTLGIYAYTLTRYRNFHRDMIFACAPVLDWLKKKTGYTTLLANLIDGEKFVLSYFEVSENPLKDRGELYKGHLYNSSTGRAMLAMMRPNKLKETIEKVGLPKEDEWPGIHSYEQLVLQLNEIKDQVVLCVFQQDGYYFYKFGHAFLGKKGEYFAIGLEVKQREKPSQEEIESIKKYMRTAIKEIKRRIQFEDI